MAVLLLASLVASSSQYDLTELVDVLDVLDDPVFLHVLHKTLLLGGLLLIALTYRGCTRRLSDRCIFDLETARGIRVQHLNSTEPPEFLLTKLARRPLSCPRTILIDHTFYEIGCKLGLTLSPI